MNRIFKVIWDTTTNTYKVAGETAKSRGKKTGGRKLAAIALLGLSAMATSGNALAGAGNDTGTGVTEDGVSAGNGWIAIGTGVTANTYTNADGASAALGYYSSAMGLWSTAIGSYSKSDGDASLALGVKANSSGDRSIAMGASSSATGSYSMAMGVRANAIGSDSVALGNGAKSTRNNAVSLGHSSDAVATDSVAIGNTATATGTDGIAIGDSTASGINSVAIGNTANASGSNTIALGNAAKANKEDAIALGNNANADAINAIAIGEGAKASGDKSIALGNDAKVTALNSVALGDGSNATEDNTIAVGNATMQRRVTYVDDGVISSSSTDAVNGSQLYKLSSSVATRLGGGASVNVNGSVNAPEYVLSDGTYNNVGDALIALDKSYTAVASDALLWNETSSAYSAAHGTETTSKITNVTGGKLSADSTDAVNGAQLFDTKQDVAQNTTEIATLNTSVTDINTSITNMGTSIINLNENALQWDETLNAYSAAHGTDTTSKITNVTAGALSAESTDAVNGAQLFETNQNVTQNTTDIATLNTSVTDINTSITDMGTSITTLTNDALLWDSTANAYSAAHGTDTASKITNVAAGTLSAESTDAVNGAQLFATNQDVAQNTTDIATLNTSVTDINTSITDMGTSITNLNENALQWDETLNAYSAAHGNDTSSKITNVAAGTLSAESTDAVNGAQLFETNQNVTQNTTDIATLNTSVTDINTSITDMGTSITTLTNDALLWDSTANAYSAAHGTDTASKITNVAAGELSAESSDAVNGAQLFATNQDVAQNTTDIATLNTSVTDINTSITDMGTTITTLSENSLQWDETLNAYSAAHGSDTASKITNVAAGELAAESTDAVNGAQLYETNLLIEQTNEAITNIAGDTSETYITNNGTGVKYVRTNDEGLAENDAHASGLGATAVGYNAVASGAGSLAMGQNSISSVDTGIALGSGSTSNRVIATGKQATSVSEDGVTIGYDTTDRTLLGALSLGTDGESYRQITNVADGTESQDAVTVRQLQNAVASVSTTPTKYFHANSEEEDSLAVGTNAIAVGAKTVVNGDEGIGIGYGATVEQTANNGIAFGTNAVANHADSIALGSYSQTGVGAQSSYIAYNLTAPQTSIGEVSVGNANGQRQITNVAAGSADTDAVNVAQLKVTDSKVTENTANITTLTNQYTNLNTRVTTLENNMGDITVSGGSDYLAVNTTGDVAIATGDESVAVGPSSMATANNSVALGAGSIADEANTVSVGSSTQQRRITNVAAGVNNTDAVNVAQLKASEEGSVRYETNTDGSVNYSAISLGDGSGGTTRISNVSAAVNDTDAVNYAQLKQSVEEANYYTDQKMGEMSSKIQGVEDKMSGGIASAMAMAGLPQAYAPGASMTSIAGGTFNGETAIALGVSVVSESGGWVYKLQGTSNSQGDYSAAIGAGFQW
ncbi:YadA-like family protein [Citrobacter sp. RHB25-C09]|uniref:YadA-like family protein n=1 Tax=Citrobacter sp. RHB25-C09 TaxID=2742624 RepID=UPI0015EE84AA|nr:YadA-like family protein [Citrobacter sp. RHB25-C09]QMI03428.1 YadA-like family protein [Citrobacter sp. RHB25-C09]